jgi:tetratricopeptide (TPR) repeat protein
MLSRLEGPVVGVDPMVNPLADASGFERVASGVVMNAYGLYLSILPFDLSCDYNFAVFPMIESAFDGRFLFAALVLCSGLVLGFYLLRSRPLVFIAMTLFFGFSFGVSNIPFAIGTTFGERLYYTPSLALSLVAADLVRCPPRWPALRRPLALALGFWLVASSALIVQRSLVWRDNRTLFLHDVVGQPRSARLQYLAADFASLDGDVARQFHHMERAFSLKPERTRAWLRFAWFLVGEEEKALEALRRGMESATGEDERYRVHLYWTHSQIMTSVGQVEAAGRWRRRALEEVALRRERPQEMAALRNALAENAPAVRGWLEMGSLLIQIDRLELAEHCLREGLNHSAGARVPHEFELHWGLAGALALQGRIDEASAELRIALRLDPDRVRERWSALQGLTGEGWSEGELLALLDLADHLQPHEGEWRELRREITADNGDGAPARL